VDKEFVLMKILIIMDPGILIPVKGYGGIERLVEMFAKEYNRMGHTVHLLITGGSTVEGCTVHDFGKEGFPPKKSDAIKTIKAAWKFLWKHKNNFDLIHNFGRLAYLIPVLRQPVMKIMTYEREITSKNVRLAQRLGGRNIVYTACSQNLLSRVHISAPWEVVYNAIEFSKYTVKESTAPDAPLIFLGRIERVKGCHSAIKAAKETNNRLIIAGNISPLPEEKIYFETEIKPLIDGKQIQYVGPLNDSEKNVYLGISKALLFPIEWNEPFGIVMIEAMACGTPVIAFNKGSVEEVIDEGLTGFKVNNFDELKIAIKNINKINREKCREMAQVRFDISVIAQRYLHIIDRARKKVVLVTTGQPAANPRVVKEYEALAKEGFAVNVLYTFSADWSYRIDNAKFKSGDLKKQDFILIGGNPYNSKIEYFFSRIIFKIFKAISKIFPLPFLKEMTIVRSSFYLWLNTKKFKANTYIAHYLGALPAAIGAARKYDGKVIFDAEDFHRGEEPNNSIEAKKIIDLENQLLPKVNLITTSSPLISEAYRKLYPSKKVITINNTFSKKYLQSTTTHENDLRLFWFSQNIGPNRGLESLIDAINLLDFKVSLGLLGEIRDQFYVNSLLKRSNKPHCISILKPVEPEKIFEVAADFDIGIAAEIPYCENRNICLTNKIFTYLLAGNCILASDTDAQKDFMNTWENVGLLYKHNDAEDLGNQIRFLRDNRDFLFECRKNALSLADSRLNWENESEKYKKIISEVLN
jgi:glycosyltransferase involved in cell wall biosynthesis